MLDHNDYFIDDTITSKKKTITEKSHIFFLNFVEKQTIKNDFYGFIFVVVASLSLHKMR